MAYSLTYSALVAELQTIVESDNPEFVAELPAIIARAQDVVQRDLGLAIWRTFLEHHVSATDATLIRQPSWLQVFSIFMPANGNFIEQRSLDWVRAHGGLGRPKYYAEWTESAFLVAPKPDMNYAVSVEVLARQPALSATNPENWISRNAADLLLLAALIGAEMYLIAPERVAEFSATYAMLLQSALTELRQSERVRHEPIREAPRPETRAGALA